MTPETSPENGQPASLRSGPWLGSVPPEVAALAQKARLMRAAQQMCGHDWVEDRASQISKADPYLTGKMLPPSPRFNGSSVCRICGERRATSALDGFTRFQSLSA